MRRMLFTVGFVALVTGSLYAMAVPAGAASAKG